MERSYSRSLDVLQSALVTLFSLFVDCPPGMVVTSLGHLLALLSSTQRKNPDHVILCLNGLTARCPSRVCGDDI